jgi:hypothetical protein
MTSLVPTSQGSRDSNNDETLLIRSRIPGRPARDYELPGSSALPAELDTELSSFVSMIPTEGRVAVPGEQPYAVDNTFRQTIVRLPRNLSSSAGTGFSAGLPSDPFAGTVVMAQDMVQAQRADTVSLTRYLQDPNNGQRVVLTSLEPLGYAVDYYRRFPNAETRAEDLQEFIGLCSSGRYGLMWTDAGGVEHPLSSRKLHNFPEVTAMAISGLGQPATASIQAGINSAGDVRSA